MALAPNYENPHIQNPNYARFNDGRGEAVSDDGSGSDRDGWCGGCDGDSSDEKADGPQNHYRYLNGSVPAYVRRDFVKKVYLILTAQLLVTIGITWGIMSMPDEVFAAIHWKAIMNVNMVLLLAFACALPCCCQQAMRTFPTNYVLLSAFTVMMATLVGTATLSYDTDVVLQAFGLTAAMFLALTAYACVTKTDFTGLGPYLYVCLLGLLFAGLLMAFIPSEMGEIIMAAAGCVLFSFYIIYDTQLIIGGKHSYQLEVDEYCFAALNLYLDIINLFLNILSLLGRSD